MMIRLEILSGPMAGQTRVFRRARVLLGPSEGLDLAAPEAAEIRLENGQGSLRAIGAARVNDAPVSGNSLLEPGDEILLGDVRFRYLLIVPPQPLTTRPFSPLERAGLAVVVVILALQLVFLVYPSLSWRSGVNQELLRPLPKPTPTPIAEPTPTPLPPAPTPDLPPTPTPLPTPVPTATPRPLPTPTPIPDTLGLSSAELARLARERQREGRSLEADRLLAQAIFLDPGNVELRMEHARLLGQRGLLRESVTAWEDVLRRLDPGSDLAREAAVELRLMRRRLNVLETTPQTPVPLPRDPAPTRARPAPTLPANPKPTVPLPQPVMPPQAARIVAEDIRVTRFADSPLYDDLRVVTFSLAHQRDAPAAAPGTLQVRVTFYEQIGSAIKPAMIPNPVIILDPKEGLAGGRRLTDLTAAYEAPKNRGIGNRSFFGVVIRVFIGGREDSVAADPPFLLDNLR